MATDTTSPTAKKVKAIKQKWAPWVATLNPVQLEVLNQYRVLVNNEPSVHVAEGKAAPFAKMNQDVAERLLALDPTEDSSWTDLIFYAAGGGKVAMDQSETQFGFFKLSFFTTDASELKIPPVQTREEAWEHSAKIYRQYVFIINESASLFLTCFGYYTKWPGRNGVYAKVEESVQAYFAALPEIQRMNAEIAAGDADLGEPIPTDPETIKGANTATSSIPDLLHGYVKTVRLFFEAKKLKTEINLAPWQEQKTVYDDDNVTLVIPTTYLAAVEYGFDDMEMAKRAGLETALRTKSSSNPWNAYRRTNQVIGFVHFNAPTPSLMAQVGMLLRRRRLDHVGIVYENGYVGFILPGGRQLKFQEFVKLFQTNEAPLSTPQGTLLDLPPDAREKQQVKPPRWDKDSAETKATLKSLQAATREFKKAASVFDRNQLQPAFS